MVGVTRVLRLTAVVIILARTGIRYGTGTNYTSCVIEMAPDTATTREADAQLQNVLKTIQEIARLLRTHEGNGELKVFYADLTAYCAVIRDHSNRINQAGHGIDHNLRAKILHHLGSVITPPTHDFSEFSRHWSALHSQQSDVARLDFVRSHVNFGHTLDSRNTFIRSLACCEDELKSLYPDDPSQWVTDGFFPSKKIREPSHSVWKAARSILGALTACQRCLCTPTHHFGARLCLGTFRKPYSVQDEDAEADDDELGFDLFLSMEREWHEARVHAVRGTAIRWQVEGSQNPEAKRKRAKPKPMRVKQLCEPIGRIRAMSSGASHRLELQVTNGKLFKLQSQRSTSPFDKTKDALSLQDFLRGGSRSFTEKTRRILAVILSSAVLHLIHTRWLPSSWSSSDVIFLPTSNSGIPLRPFLHTVVPDSDPDSDTSSKTQSYTPLKTAGSDSWSDGSEGIDPDDLDPDDLIQHPCPMLVTLAIILLEVYFATPLDVLAARYSVTLADGHGAPKSAQHLDASLVFEACRGEIPENSQFHYAVEKCLDPTVWEDEEGDPLDDSTLRSTIYREVVQPLETELMQAYSSIPIDDLDRYAQGLNFASWDQPILPHQDAPPEMPVEFGMAASLVTTHPPSRCASPFPPPVTLLSQKLSLQPAGPHQYQYLDISKHTVQTAVVELPQSTTLDHQTFKFFDDETPSEAHTNEA